MTDKIYLGRTDCGPTYLTKHEWQCDWYWAFGYLGNHDNHFHIESMIKSPEEYDPDWTDVDAQFTSTWLTQDDWWIIRDVFKSAYALKDAADVYKHGGHQTSADLWPLGLRPDDTVGEKAAAINADLEKLLNAFWAWLGERRADYERGKR